MNSLPALNTAKTMLSTEIVKIINALREEGQAELLHKSFLAKVLKVLGEEQAKSFAGQYKAGNGQMRHATTCPNAKPS